MNDGGVDYAFIEKLMLNAFIVEPAHGQTRRASDLGACNGHESGYVRNFGSEETA